MRILIFLIALNTCTQLPAQDQDIIKIEFTSLSRGYYEKVEFTKDSLISKKSQNRGTAEQIYQKEVTQKQWASLVSELRTIELSTLPSLKSPTMKRAYDGARHSSLTIYTSENSYQHVFDDENPDKSLKGLMNNIIKLKK